MIEFEINREIGGALTSVKFNGKEMLRQSKDGNWKFSDHTLFPFCGCMFDSYYLHEGKKYEIKIHGLLNYMKPEIVVDEPNYKKVIFKSDENTISQYPFDFKVFVEYIAYDSSLEVKTTIFNESSKIMPYSLGWHPAITAPFAQSGNNKELLPLKLYFLSPTKLREYMTAPTSYYSDKFIEHDGNVLEFSYENFKNGHSILIDTKGVDKVRMIRLDDIVVEYELRGAPVVTIWAEENHCDYLCVEPWWGMPDSHPIKRNINDKYLINFIKPKSSESKSYKMTFIKNN